MKNFAFTVLLVTISLCFMACKDKQAGTSADQTGELSQTEDLSQSADAVAEAVFEVSPESFIKNNRLVDTVYVARESIDLYINQARGDSYSAKAPKDFALKVIALGDSVTIGNIKAPMLEVYYPLYNSFVWVFGGDVEFTKTVFRPENGSTSDLSRYLTSSKWSQNNIPWEVYKIRSFQNGEYDWYLIESGGSFNGFWRTLSSSSIEVNSKFADEAQEDEDYREEIWNLTDIRQNSFKCKGDTYYRTIPLYDIHQKIVTQYDGQIEVLVENSPDAVLTLQSIDYSDYPLTSENYFGANDWILGNNLKLLAKYGIPVENFDFSNAPDDDYLTYDGTYKGCNIQDLYRAEYIKYWYPIMEREQQKYSAYNFDYPKAVPLAFNEQSSVEIKENLRLRSSYDLDSDIIATVKAGSKAYIDTIGPMALIDNIYSNWVYIWLTEYDNGTPVLDEQQGGWCFGGYLNTISEPSPDDGR